MATLKAIAMATFEGGADSKHKEIEIDVSEPNADEVQIKVTHCGLCHSDVCLAKGEWPGLSAYHSTPGSPQVSGHEVIGVVVKVGSCVKNLKEGQRIGVGWYKDSCRNCEQCEIGKESTCLKGTTATAAGGNKGGFSQYLNVSSDFAFPIPDNLPSEYAASLLCGGITCYSPLIDNQAFGKKVGIVGLGGIGLMAVQFAKALGNVVTVFSTSPAKETPAKEAGATNFINTSVAGALDGAACSVDLIIVTAPANLDWSAYLNCLRPHGRMIFIGAVPGPVTLPIFGPMLFRQLMVGASITGGRPRIKELLQFVADHKCYPQIETFPFSEVDNAIEKVEKGTIRFRAVMKW